MTPNRVNGLASWKKWQRGIVDCIFFVPPWCVLHVLEVHVAFCKYKDGDNSGS